MPEELLEAQAIEEDAGPAPEAPGTQVRPLPVRQRASEVDAWRGEVRTAALAAAGGIVAGAATVAAVRAVRGAPRGARPSRLPWRRQQQRPVSIVASRSFLVDIHLLGDR